MPNLDRNYINKFTLPNTTTLVIFNGIYQPALSDKYDDLICFDHQTLKISPKATITKPIHLLLLTSQNSAYSIDIIAEENCSFTLLEEHASIENQPYTNDIKINILAKNSSEITYYKLQAENDTATHNAQTTIKQEQNSKINSGFIGKGAKFSQDLLHIKLIEKNASYNAIGIIALHDTQALNYQIQIEHMVPNCTSNVLFKGLIDDKASGNFNCLVVTHPNAAKTETHVSNNNLLLSAAATMNTAPALETYADDVICTHGATVGQLDQDALFYLRARGLSENQAMQLLITAFIQELIDRFAKFYQPKITLGTAYEH